VHTLRSRERDEGGEQEQSGQWDEVERDDARDRADPDEHGTPPREPLRTGQQDRERRQAEVEQRRATWTANWTIVVPTRPA
jgi:hypothetical protein